MSNSKFTRSYIPTSSSTYSITDSESDAYFTDARSHMTGVSAESSSDEEANNTHNDINNNNNSGNIIRNSLISDEPNGTSLSPQVTITEEIPPTSQQELQLDDNFENEQNSILTNTNLNSQPANNQYTMNAAPTPTAAATATKTVPVETAPVEKKPLDTPKLNEKSLAVNENGNTDSPNTDDSDKTETNFQSNEKVSDNIVNSQPLPNDSPSYKKTEEAHKKAYVNTDANKNRQGGAPRKYKKEQSECAEYWSECQCCPCCSCDREAGENIFVFCATCITTSCVSMLTASTCRC